MFTIVVIVLAALPGLWLLWFAGSLAFALLHEKFRPRRHSLMSAEGYDDSRGERSLWNPVPVPLDSAIAEIVRRYAASDAAGRARMRDAIDEDHFYELLTFSKRAAVFALRERSTERVRDGLAAIAMIDMARNNAYSNDIFTPVALLHDAATRIGADAAVLLREAAALAKEPVDQFLDAFPDRPARDKDLRKSALLEEVQTPGGPGFVRRGTRDYQPTVDLVSAGVEMMDVLASDKYQPGDLTIAEELPSMWLRAGGAVPGAVSLALHSARACAVIHTSLRPEVHPRNRAYSLRIFLVELADEQDARTLQDASRQVRHRGIELLGIAEGRLFCLVMAEVWGIFVKPYETPERLARFQAPLSAVLRRHAGGGPRP